MVCNSFQFPHSSAIDETLQPISTTDLTTSTTNLRVINVELTASYSCCKKLFNCSRQTGQSGVTIVEARQYQWRDQRDAG